MQLDGLIGMGTLEREGPSLLPSLFGVTPKEGFR